MFEFKACEVFKIKEFTFVIDCFKYEHNEEIGHYGQTLDRHNTKYYGNNKYTSKTDDWILYLEIICNSMKQAMFIERHIKKMKSKKYIRNLKNYPEIIEKLKNKYDC